MPRSVRRTGWLVLLVQLAACSSWHTESVAPERVLADREPEQVRITEPGGAQMVVLQPTVAADTLRGRSEPGGSLIAIPLGRVLRLETRRSNLVTSRVVVAAMGLGVAGIIVACSVSSC
jgi:hypothetical protein